MLKHNGVYFCYFRNHQGLVSPTPNILKDSLGWQIANKKYLLWASEEKKSEPVSEWREH